MPFHSLLHHCRWKSRTRFFFLFIIFYIFTISFCWVSGAGSFGSLPVASSLRMVGASVSLRGSCPGTLVFTVLLQNLERV